MKLAQPKAPEELKCVQTWFGKIIARPLKNGHDIDPVAPSGQSVEEESKQFIVPSLTLKPMERIQIYNQQYWWRLLKVLQESFPVFVYLLGHDAFNETIGVPYLLKYPPDHWSLALTGSRLPKWIEEEYHCRDKELMIESARIDYGFSFASVVKGQKPLSSELSSNPEKCEEILSQKLYVQPYVQLFAMGGDFFKFRETLHRHSYDHWMTHPFPEVIRDKEHYFVLYPDEMHLICWKEVSAGEYHLLRLFQSGITIDAASEWMETKGEQFFDGDFSQLQGWFQQWTANGWLTLYT